MRHPSSVKKDDDLSRLTTSSSSSATSSSSSSSSSSSTSRDRCVDYPIDSPQITPEYGNSTYLPSVIDSSEWHSASSRKRKERQDSTSSLTNERKFVRSNSEEYIPNLESEVIRRVSSHEEFKNTITDTNNNNNDNINNNNNNVNGNGNDNNVVVITHNSKNSGILKETSTNNEVQEILREAHKRIEISPARSRTFDYSHRYRLSPHRDLNHHRYSNGTNAIAGTCKYGNSNNTDDTDGEHERRRNSERFCKARATTSGRKISSKKFNKYITKSREKDDIAYKYDINNLQLERRGFISNKNNIKQHQLNGTTQITTAAAAASPTNIIDNDSQQTEKENSYDKVINSKTNFHNNYNNNIQQSQNHNNNNNNNNNHHQQQKQNNQQEINNDITCNININANQSSNNINKSITKAETLPWDRQFHDVDTPVVCQRFADNTFNHVNNSRTTMNHHHHHHLTYLDGISSSASSTATNELKSQMKNCTNIENLKTREIMQNIPPSAIYRASPDERLKQINKRMIACKKRLTNFEDSFQRENGYKPSHLEKLNDRYMKNTMSEIHKLRKEKQLLKNDPMAAMAMKVTQNGGNKIVKMTETIDEIELRLQDKRDEDKRSIVLDDLTPDQLVQEKTDIQKGLLYFESLYGRPNAPEERNIARALYDRYRSIKRLVNRSASTQCTVVGVPPELPTILEHEAMIFTVPTTTASDLNSPTDSSIILSPEENISTSETCITSGGQQSTASLVQVTNNENIGASSSFPVANTTTPIDNDINSNLNENIHTLSFEELSIELKNAREAKKNLGRTIKEFEQVFEEHNGRKMLKSDRTIIENTYALYKQKKAKLRLLDALVKKHMAK